MDVRLSNCFILPDAKASINLQRQEQTETSYFNS